ncbi:hypothetical protein [Christensenella timonensis]|nr:hypothetical protein [Christensenella timonensis]
MVRLTTPRQGMPMGASRRRREKGNSLLPRCYANALCQTCMAGTVMT